MSSVIERNLRTIIDLFHPFFLLQDVRALIEREDVDPTNAPVGRPNPRGIWNSTFSPHTARINPKADREIASRS